MTDDEALNVLLADDQNFGVVYVVAGAMFLGFVAMDMWQSFLKRFF